VGKKYIQLGWDSYLDLVVPKGASDVQIAETRQAFFSGAAVLFEGIMRMLDPGLEETDADMQRMTDIQNEITAFGQELDKRILKLTEH